MEFKTDAFLFDYFKEKTHSFICILLFHNIHVLIFMCINVVELELVNNFF